MIGPPREISKARAHLHALCSPAILSFGTCFRCSMQPATQEQAGHKESIGGQRLTSMVHVLDLATAGPTLLVKAFAAKIPLTTIVLRRLVQGASISTCENGCSST